MLFNIAIRFIMIYCLLSAFTSFFVLQKGDPDRHHNSI